MSELKSERMGSCVGKSGTVNISDQDNAKNHKKPCESQGEEGSTKMSGNAQTTSSQANNKDSQKRRSWKFSKFSSKRRKTDVSPKEKNDTVASRNSETKTHLRREDNDRELNERYEEQIRQGENRTAKRSSSERSDTSKNRRESKKHFRENKTLDGSHGDIYSLEKTETTSDPSDGNLCSSDKIKEFDRESGDLYHAKLIEITSDGNNRDKHPPKNRECVSAEIKTTFRVNEGDNDQFQKKLETAFDGNEKDKKQFPEDTERYNDGSEREKEDVLEKRETLIDAREKATTIELAEREDEHVAVETANEHVAEGRENKSVVLKRENNVVPSQIGVQRTILVMGTAGYGKSATANSILGQDLFETSDGAASETDSIVKKSLCRDGRNLTVVDGLTLPDVRMSKSQAEQVSADLLRKCFACCPEGFDLLVLVLNYDNRVTEEDRVAAATFKTMLGDESFSTHCVVIFTHGESFLLQQKKRGITSFQHWLQHSQNPTLTDIINTAGGKAFLFYNESPEMMEKPTEEFFEILDNISEKILLN